MLAAGVASNCARYAAGREVGDEPDRRVREQQPRRHRDLDVAVQPHADGEAQRDQPQFELPEVLSVRPPDRMTVVFMCAPKASGEVPSRGYGPTTHPIVAS